MRNFILVVTILNFVALAITFVGMVIEDTTAGKVSKAVQFIITMGFAMWGGILLWGR